MDPRSAGVPTTTVTVLGCGAAEAPEEADACLKDQAFHKFMAKQDRLALAAARRAAGSVALDARCGLYVTTGRLAFEDESLDRLARDSTENGAFANAAFCERAFFGMRPVQTFKCLTYMPPFHISYNLGIHGPYFVTYPGAGQWLQALDLAMQALRRGEIRHALVGAVADQRNFLVRDHVATVNPGALASLRDQAVFFLLGADSALADAPKLSLSAPEFSPEDPTSASSCTTLAAELFGKLAASARGEGKFTSDHVTARWRLT